MSNIDPTAPVVLNLFGHRILYPPGTIIRMIPDDKAPFGGVLSITLPTTSVEPIISIGPTSESQESYSLEGILDLEGLTLPGGES